MTNIRVPSAEETLDKVVGGGCNFRKLFGDNDTDWIVKAMNSHRNSIKDKLIEVITEWENDSKDRLNQPYQLGRETAFSEVISFIEQEVSKW